jgi:hypothetical protein
MSAQSQAAKDIKSEEERREERIKTGTQVIRHNFANSFNDDYYKKIEALGYKAVQPDVDRQYNDSMRQLQAALARNGLLGSTARGSLEARLEGERKAAYGKVDDSVRGSLNARRADVANAEMAAIGQLQASADPSSAAAQAATLTAANSAAPRWSPLGQVFTDVTAGLATQADLERNAMNRYNLGISNWNPNVRRYASNIGGGS